MQSKYVRHAYMNVDIRVSTLYIALMKKARSVALHVRVTPEFAAKLAELAEQEIRPLASLLAILLEDGYAARMDRSK
jgi:hypothetical protein